MAPKKAATNRATASKRVESKPKPRNRSRSAAQARRPARATVTPKRAPRQAVAVLSPDGSVSVSTAAAHKLSGRRTAPARKPKAQAAPRIIPVEASEKNREAAPVAPVAASRRLRRPAPQPPVASREGATFVQLFTRDAESLLVFWQTSAQAVGSLLSEIGERTLALARPTLRVTDERGLRPEFVLLPDEARSCTLQVDPRRIAYRVEYGYTLPSGEFRRLAESATVRPPSPAPPGRVATARARVDMNRRPPTLEESRRRIEQAIRAGDWARAHAIAEVAGVEVVAVLDRRPTGGSSEASVRGGASDQHR